MRRRSREKIQDIVCPQNIQLSLSHVALGYKEYTNLEYQRIYTELAAAHVFENTVADDDRFVVQRSLISEGQHVLIRSARPSSVYINDGAEWLNHLD